MYLGANCPSLYFPDHVLHCFVDDNIVSPQRVSPELSAVERPSHGEQFHEVSPNTFVLASLDIEKDKGVSRSHGLSPSRKQENLDGRELGAVDQNAILGLLKASEVAAQKEGLRVDEISKCRHESHEC